MRLSIAFLLLSCIGCKSLSTAKSSVATPVPGAKQTLIPPPKIDVPGIRIEMGPKRQIYVPDFFRPTSSGTQLVFFFLGASWCSEQEFYRARRNAILITVNSVEKTDFERMGDEFPLLIEKARKALESAGIASGPLAKICISSFSGGYTAIREILKRPELADQVSDVVLADSLYCARVEGKENVLEPSGMKPFLDYASRAAEGKCGFWFSHLYPPEEQYRGNTTTLAANYLIDALGAVRVDRTEKNSRGARLLYRADKGNFHVLGYAGMTTQDHFEHFYSLRDLFRKTSLPPARHRFFTLTHRR